MKDIKTLYLFARSSESPKDVTNYCEAVDDMYRNNHYEFVSNLEYIIPSSYGIKIFRKFIETYSIPLIAYDSIMETLDNAIGKFNVRNLSSIYKEYHDYDECKKILESFKRDYKNSFIMFEYYNDGSISYDEYLELYYNRYFDSNIPSVLNRFGEAAIPDVIISSVSNNRTDITFKFLSEAVESSEGNAIYYQWLSEVTKDIKNPSDKLNLLIGKFNEGSLEGVVRSIKMRNDAIYKESILMDDDNINIEYSESDIQHMQDYIIFKEYYMTTLDDFDNIQSIQNQIISIYEEFNGLVDEDAVDLVEMLPSVNNITSEATVDKRRGEAPAYLSKHHDLTYGEDILSNNKILDDEEDNDIIKSTIPSYTPPATSSVTDNPVYQHHDSKTTDAIPGTGVNNYYYTYNNSFNKNNRDDHSTHSSLEYNTDTKNKANDVKMESAPWELNIFDNHEIYTEGILDTMRSKSHLQEAIIPPDIMERYTTYNTDNILDTIIESSETSDPLKPSSDHPVRDTLMDIDRKLTKKQQDVKKTVQAAINVGSVFIKPARRTVGWIDSMIGQWKDRNENQIKEKMADPRARNSLYTAIRKSIEIGSLFKARLLFNPIFMFLTITKKASDNKNQFRIRNEMIGELKAELDIIDEKIKDADLNRDSNAKYKLMRLRTEINKKLLRVAGGKDISKII